MTVSVSRVTLSVLTCRACRSPVPLADADTTPCPACRATVAIPFEHREARRLTLEATKREALGRAWLERASRPPPRWFKWLSVFESGRLWGLFLFGLPVVICLSTSAIPFLARTVLRVRLIDVLPEEHFAALIIGTPFLVMSLGLLVAGFVRGTFETRAALAAALGGQAPSTEGGVWTCRHCGAPLSVAEAVFEAQCDFCHVDNLVRIPKEWLDEARRVAERLGTAIQKVETDWRETRARRRRSLVVRTAFGLGLMGLVTGPILVVEPASGSTLDVALLVPESMPDWTRHRVTAGGRCAPRYARPLGCTDSGCRAALLVAAQHGNRLTVTPDDADVTALSLEPRAVGLLETFWARGLPPTQAGTFDVPESGWYRLVLNAPTQRGAVPVCIGVN